MNILYQKRQKENTFLIDHIFEREYTLAKFIVGTLQKLSSMFLGSPRNDFKEID
jgi:hypothetical protein